MENASKALIIAGAIILSILIIGLGMFIFQKANSATEGADLSSQKVKAYNSVFEQYVGTQTGINVKALLDEVRSHNLANASDASLNIDVQESSQAATTTPPTAAVTAATVNTIRAKIQNGKSYTVDFGYDASTGFIVAVGIVDK
jgi:anti-sigma28 factor (negative regulator of flagellin synthesis)